MEIKVNPWRWKNSLIKGIKASISSKRRISITFLIILSSFLTSVLSANPGYSAQMITAGIQYWQTAVITRLSGLIALSGYTGLILTTIFSALVGVTVTNSLIQLRANRINLDSLGAIPGFLAAGCASCGVGVLSLLGLGGVLATLPFQGNLLRLAAVLILTAIIIRTGNPETCRIQ